MFFKKKKLIKDLEIKVKGLEDRIESFEYRLQRFCDLREAMSREVKVVRTSNLKLSSKLQSVQKKKLSTKVFNILLDHLGLSIRTETKMVDKDGHKTEPEYKIYSRIIVSATRLDEDREVKVDTED